MSDVNYSTESYCALCDLYFPTVHDRTEHVAESTKHPTCEPCCRRFLNGNARRNHFVYSRRHHYCASCEVSFKSSAALQTHIDRAPIHVEDSDEEEEYYNNLDTLEDVCSEGDSDVESVDHPDDDSDVSWEQYDDYDFEDEEDLGDLVPEDLAYTHAIREESDQNEDGAPVQDFTCPICRLPPKTFCSTMCGHMFCGPCIEMVLSIQEACPVCDMKGSVNELRKLYISV